MTLRQFMDAGYTLLVEEYQRVNVDLLSALEKTQEWAAGGKKDESKTVSKNQNDQAMAALTARMAGVKGINV
jgi:hypothetical protein